MAKPLLSVTPWTGLLLHALLLLLLMRALQQPRLGLALEGLEHQEVAQVSSSSSLH
jgi:hypothetical protein